MYWILVLRSSQSYLDLLCEQGALLFCYFQFVGLLILMYFWNCVIHTGTGEGLYRGGAGIFFLNIILNYFRILFLFESVLVLNFSCTAFWRTAEIVHFWTAVHLVL